MINGSRLRAFATDPGKFRNSLLIDTDDGPVRLGDVVDDWQLADFEAADPGWLRCIGQKATGGCSRQWWERSRGHSKSTDAGVMICWGLLFASRQVRGVVCAADKDQAAITRQAIERLLFLNRGCLRR